jgi:protein phosphatase 1L
MQPLEDTKLEESVTAPNLRGNSLESSVLVGVCTHQGGRSCMEDVHNYILWTDINTKEQAGASKTDEGERAPKRLRITELKDENQSEAQIENKEESDESDSIQTKVSFFAVCDGHGGVQAADFVNAHLFNKIISRPCLLSDPIDAITSGFAEVEEEFVRLAREKEFDGMVGTTVTAVLILGSILFVANLGDSEAVLCSKGKVKVLTECHSTNNEMERKRVEAVGGIIVRDRHGAYRLGHPVWNPTYVNIAVTRSIGDIYFKCAEYVDSKQSGLIATPSIKKVELTGDEKFMIIASDGFWDVVKYEEAVDLVLGKLHLECSEICEQLVELSKSRNSSDNVTVLLVKLTVVP